MRSGTPAAEQSLRPGFRVPVLLLLVVLLPGCEGVVDRALAPFIEPIVFGVDYVSYVCAETPEESLPNLGAWYDADAVRPDFDQVRGSLSFPGLQKEEASLDDWPVHDAVVSLNMMDGEELAAGAVILDLKRVSEPGDQPVFTLIVHSTDEEEDIEVPIRYRHEADLPKNRMLLTFELWGGEPQTGERKRQRHQVAFVERPERKESESFFVVTCHTIEELPPPPND